MFIVLVFGLGKVKVSTAQHDKDRSSIGSRRVRAPAPPYIGVRNRKKDHP